MEFTILGHLMLRCATVYEIKQFIGTYMTSVSSNSTGSIQAGMKKLLEKEWITCREKVENGVNKKIYSITEAGKKNFLENLSAPMCYKEKNMELNKLFFLGLIEKKQQIVSIENYILELEKELGMLMIINEGVQPRFQIDQQLVEDIKQNSGAPELIDIEKAYDIAKFQYTLLDFSIDKLQFEIQWFRRLKEGLEKGEKDNDGK